MSAPAFTPGPWSCAHREGDDGMYRTQVFCPAGKTIANVAWYPVDQGNGVTATSRAANAQLMAASPLLLKACQQAIHALKGREHDGFLRDAIEAATGERP